MFGEKGLVHIYTGEGKGKTTAALGLALRAAGHGAHILMIQFMKGWGFYGELEASKSIAGLTIVQTGRPDYVYRGKETEEDFKEAGRGLALAEDAMKRKNCDMLILDEIIVAADYGLIPREKIMALIKCKPEEMELVLTGRGATGEMIAAADLVTEMKKIKHPYDLGVVSRKAVEY